MAGGGGVGTLEGVRRETGRVPGDWACSSWRAAERVAVVGRDPETGGLDGQRGAGAPRAAAAAAAVWEGLATRALHGSGSEEGTAAGHSW